jgi:hypothetical protein
MRLNYARLQWRADGVDINVSPLAGTRYTMGERSVTGGVGVSTRMRRSVRPRYEITRVHVILWLDALDKGVVRSRRIS